MSEAAEALYPSLGGQVVSWMENYLVHGPGAVSGRPYRLNLELQALTWMAYEVFPQHHRRAGQRVHNDVFFSRAKGTAKTEWAGGLGGAELAGGPVRCDGFDAAGNPVGIGVHDPDIPFLATTESQAKDLAFTRARKMLTGGGLADRVYDTGVSIQLADAPGQLYHVTSKAISKDGYLPTFAHADETHLFWTDELHELVRVVWEGLGKHAAGGWGLQTSTAYQPGQRSVAEGAHELHRAIVRGEVTNDFGFLFSHLEARQDFDLDDDAQLRAAILEAAGRAAHFRNVDYIVARFRDPRTDPIKWRRYWLNQVLKSANAWLSPDDIAECVRGGRGLKVRRREAIVIGFDGSLYDDSTALIGKRLSDGHVFVIGIWEKPTDPREAKGWRVDTADVDATFRQAMREYEVLRAVCDLHFWQDYIDRWAADFPGKVARFDTRQEQRMTKVVERAQTNIENHAVTFDGHARFVDHLENTRTQETGPKSRRTTEERAPVVLCKEHDKSDLKIDCSIGFCLAEQAAADVVELGLVRKNRSSKLRVH